MRKQAYFLMGAAFALTSVWALAQDNPESSSAPRNPPRAAATPPTANAGISTPVVGTAAKPDAIDDGTLSMENSASAAASTKKFPALDQLARMTPEELEAVLGLKPKYDIPSAARRALKKVGVINQEEGGLGGNFASQNTALVRTSLEKNQGHLVSRWGHILLRRALVTRVDSPKEMNPADFAALRTSLLVRMGEGDAARALVQDVDTSNFTPNLTQAAFTSYLATADIMGICPAVILQGDARKDPEWVAARAICAEYQNEGASGNSFLQQLQRTKAMSEFDLSLVRKYVGSISRKPSAVTLRWDDIKDMTPWRYGFSLAVGVQPPEAITKNLSPYYAQVTATAPMAGLTVRAGAADVAAADGVLSSAAMVDIYGQIHSSSDITGEWADLAGLLRKAYIARVPSERLEAITQLWGDGFNSKKRYARQVLTAYAAARLPVSADFAKDADGLIASMLTAGLVENAERWSNHVEVGSDAWALLTLVSSSGTLVDAGSISSYRDDDSSDQQRKSALFMASLAGLGRLSPDSRANLSEELGVNLGRQTRWSQLISQAAEVNNPVLVVYLASLGMQGDDWSKMTPLHLYHIVAALNRVGLKAEAQMIASEAISRS